MRPEWLPEWYGYARTSEDGNWCMCSDDPHNGNGDLHYAFTVGDSPGVYGMICGETLWCDSPTCEAKARAAITGETE